MKPVGAKNQTVEYTSQNAGEEDGTRKRTYGCRQGLAMTEWTPKFAFQRVKAQLHTFEVRMVLSQGILSCRFKRGDGTSVYFVKPTLRDSNEGW